MRNMNISTGIIADIRDRQIRKNGTGTDMLRFVSLNPRLYAKPSLRWHLHLKQATGALLTEPGGSVHVASAARHLAASATAC